MSNVKCQTHFYVAPWASRSRVRIGGAGSRRNVRWCHYAVENRDSVFRCVMCLESGDSSRTQVANCRQRVYACLLWSSKFQPSFIYTSVSVNVDWVRLTRCVSTCRQFAAYLRMASGRHCSQSGTNMMYLSSSSLLLPTAAPCIQAPLDLPAQHTTGC